MLLSGCGGGDHFAAGTWAMDAWMESDLGSGREMPGVHQRDTVQLSDNEAAMPPEAVLFGRFYHGMRNAEVRFENGRISGQYKQPRVDDIAAQTVPIRGTYARDRFHLDLEYAVFGMKMRQVVEGKLVAPAH